MCSSKANVKMKKICKFVSFFYKRIKIEPISKNHPHQYVVHHRFVGSRRRCCSDFF